MTQLIPLGAEQDAITTEENAPIMRIFEFVIAPSDVKPFLEAGQKNIETSVQSEPGVLSMYCAIDKSDPNKLYVVEIYRDQTAYQSHVESPHFKAFSEAIRGKVISQEVTQTRPVNLGAKNFNWSYNQTHDAGGRQQL